MTTTTPPVIAVLGATGLVGRAIIEFLAARKVPVKRLVPLASKRSVGQTIPFNEEALAVVEATPEAFDGVDLVLASAGGAISEQLVPEAVKRGAVVIDNSSFYRMYDSVPLVVAGVNDKALDEHAGIIANPNCSTAQLMPVLGTLAKAQGIKRVMVSTYQSVSGSGKEGLDGLRQSTADFLKDDEGKGDTVAPFQRPIAGNLIPHIDVFCDDDEVKDYTKEEVKLIRETRKILGLPHLKIAATAVRVPVMVGHSESVTIDLERPCTPAKVAKLLKDTPDVVVAERREDYHTPREIAGTDPVYVSRIRRDTSNPAHGIQLWVVADNLRIGAALNAVRLAELVIAKNLCTVPEHHVFNPKPAPEPVVEEDTSTETEVEPAADEPAKRVLSLNADEAEGLAKPPNLDDEDEETEGSTTDAPTPVEEKANV